jgi:murein DD-endopeptidase MepM/ murein hydrolase activator NlpD
MGNKKQGVHTSRFISVALALFLILSFLPVKTHAGTKAAPVKIALSPKKAGPGDIMVITVTAGQGPVEGTFFGKPLHFNEAKQGFKAIVGVDLNTEPGSYPLELSVNNAKLSRTVKIVKKKYPLQKLTLPQDMVVLSPENEARAEQEQKKVAALWPVDSLRLWNGNFIDPVPGKKIGSGVFGVRRIINNVPKNPHSGVDVLADEGEPVHAPNDGVAVLVDNQFYSGNCVFLDHGQGIYTMFFHLSKANVKTGQAVAKGDVIGLVGATGRASGAHLHWGVRIQGAKVDPLELIRLKLE